MHLLAQESPPVAALKEILSDIAKDDERAGEIIRRMSALIRKRELETQPSTSTCSWPTPFGWSRRTHRWRRGTGESP